MHSQIYAGNMALKPTKASGGLKLLSGRSQMRLSSLMRARLGVAGTAVILASFGYCQQQMSGGGSWPFAGGDLNNDRNAGVNSGINTKNIKNLKMKWAFTTHGDVSATPTVGQGSVYAVDWGGYLYSINATTGAQQWAHK